MSIEQLEGNWIRYKPYEGHPGYMYPQSLAKTKEVAAPFEWKVKPIEIDGKDYYAIIWHPEAYDLFRKVIAKGNWQRKQHLRRLLKKKTIGLEFIAI